MYMYIIRKMCYTFIYFSINKLFFVISKGRNKSVQHNKHPNRYEAQCSHIDLAFNLFTNKTYKLLLFNWNYVVMV